MYGFDGIWKCNYFGEVSIRRAEVGVRERNLRNVKATGKDDISGEMIKGGGDRVVDWICRLCV